VVPEAAPGPAPFSAVELRQISTHITTQWFLPVEGNRLTLLEIDPWRVHAYWNVAEADLAAARASLPDPGGGAALVLRFTDLSPRTADAAAPHPRFDIEVQQARNNWYIGLWRDAKHYAAELGLRAPDGAFVGLLRSNEVVTPRSGPSPELDFHLLEVRPPRVPAVRHAATGADPNEGLLRDLYPKRLPRGEVYPLAAAEITGGALDEPPFPALPGEVAPPAGSWEAVDSAEAARAATAGATDAFPEVPSAEIDPYRAAARQAKARALADLGSDLPAVTEEAVSPSDVHLEPQPLPAAVTRPAEAWVRAEGGYSLGGTHAPEGAAAWQPVIIPLEAVIAGATSSPHLEPVPPEVFVDLVIRGRRTGIGQITLCGEPVQAQDDGSFSVSLPLELGTELAEVVRRWCARHGGGGGG
jgi:hypothetical protein